MSQKFPITSIMKKITGLTMVELLVAMTAVAILIGFGLPQLQGLSSGNRMTATINALATDLSLARSEAVTRNRLVTINPQGAGWATGWIVNAPAVPGLVASQIRVAGPIPAGMTLLLAGGPTASYASDGLSAAGGILTFTLCEPNKNRRILSISQAGRHSVTRGALCP